MINKLKQEQEKELNEYKKEYKRICDETKRMLNTF